LISRQTYAHGATEHASGTESHHYEYSRGGRCLQSLQAAAAAAAAAAARRTPNDQNTSQSVGRRRRRRRHNVT